MANLQSDIGIALACSQRWSNIGNRRGVESRSADIDKPLSCNGVNVEVDRVVDDVVLEDGSTLDKQKRLAESMGSLFRNRFNN